MSENLKVLFQERDYCSARIEVSYQNYTVKMIRQLIHSGITNWTLYVKREADNSYAQPLIAEELNDSALWSAQEVFDLCCQRLEIPKGKLKLQRMEYDPVATLTTKVRDELLNKINEQLCTGHRMYIEKITAPAMELVRQLGDKIDADVHLVFDLSTLETAESHRSSPKKQLYVISSNGNVPDNGRYLKNISGKISLKKSIAKAMDIEYF